MKNNSKRSRSYFTVIVAVALALFILFTLYSAYQADSIKSLLAIIFPSLRSQELTRGTFVSAGLVILSFLLLVILFVWWIPHLIHPTSAKKHSYLAGQESFENRNRLRENIFKFLQLAIALFAVLYFLPTLSTYEFNRSNAVSERFLNSIEGLNPNKESSSSQRIASLLILEQIARENPERYSNSVLMVISAFVKEVRNIDKICPTEGTKIPDSPESIKKLGFCIDFEKFENQEIIANFCEINPLPSEIQLAIDILGGRGYTNGTNERMLDLRNTNLACAKFSGYSRFVSSWTDTKHRVEDYESEESLVKELLPKANLKFLDLRASILTGADFSFAHVYKSDFTEAIVNRANFNCTDIREQTFQWKSLQTDGRT